MKNKNFTISLRTWNLLLLSTLILFMNLPSLSNINLSFKTSTESSLFFLFYSIVLLIPFLYINDRVVVKNLESNIKKVRNITKYRRIRTNYHSFINEFSELNTIIREFEKEFKNFKNDSNQFSIKKGEELSKIETKLPGLLKSMNHIFNDINSLIITDFYGVIEFINPNFLEITGFTSKDILGTNIFDLIQVPEIIITEINNQLKENQIWKGDLKLRNQMGKIKWISSYFTPIFDSNSQLAYYFIIGEDISTIMELMVEIQRKSTFIFEEKLKIEIILNNIPNGVIVFDLDYNILFVNNYMKSYYKKEFDESISKNMNIFKYKNNNFVDLLSNLLINNKSEMRIFKLPSDQYWQVEFEKINEAIIIVVVKNITEFIEFEKIQKQFVANVSHELRTPISAISMSIYNHMSYKEKLSEERQKILFDIIWRNSDILKTMIDDLLILSRIDSKKLNINRWESFKITSQVQNVIIQLKPQMEKKNIQINLNSNQDLFVYGDFKRFNQVIRIILDNAIKYSLKDSDIEINVIDDYIGKFNKDEISGLLIEVKDFGIGIAKSDLNNLFKRFYRGKNVQDVQGTGIGLTILKEISNLFGGNVYVESIIKKGTSFFLFLPKFKLKKDLIDYLNNIEKTDKVEIIKV